MMEPLLIERVVSKSINSTNVYPTDYTSRSSSTTHVWSQRPNLSWQSKSLLGALIVDLSSRKDAIHCQRPGEPRPDIGRPIVCLQKSQNKARWTGRITVGCQKTTTQRTVFLKTQQVSTSLYPTASDRLQSTLKEDDAMRHVLSPGAKLIPNLSTRVKENHKKKSVNEI